MAAKFTKHGDQVNSLTEMQAMWYEIECGHAHLRRRAYGKVRLSAEGYPVASVLAAWVRIIMTKGKVWATFRRSALVNLIPHACSRRIIFRSQ